MKNKILALAFLLTAAPVFAQNPVAANLSSATAGSVAFLVKYVGTATSATVAVAAGGDMTFEVSAAASTSINSAAICGVTAGTVDLSTPAVTCDTLGEVVDMINATSDWRAVLVDGLRSDSSDNTLYTLVTAQATLKNGLAIYEDATVSLHPGRALLPEGCQTNINCFMTPQGKLIENPSAGKLIDLRWVAGYNTWNTTSNFYIYSVKSSNKAKGSETVTTLWTEATGATGTNKQLTQFQYFGLLGRPHEKVVVRMVVTATMSAPALQAYGVEKAVN